MLQRREQFRGGAGVADVDEGAGEQRSPPLRIPVPGEGVVHGLAQRGRIQSSCEHRPASVVRRAGVLGAFPVPQRQVADSVGGRPADEMVLVVGAGQQRLMPAGRYDSSCWRGGVAARSGARIEGDLQKEPPGGVGEPEPPTTRSAGYGGDWPTKLHLATEHPPSRVVNPRICGCAGLRHLCSKTPQWSAPRGATRSCGMHVQVHVCSLAS